MNVGSTHLALYRPMFPHRVVPLERGGLVDGHHHRLAEEAAPEEVPQDVLRHRLQSVVALEDVVLPAQFPFELQLPRAVLVEERHRRAVLDGLLEVVDGNDHNAREREV